MATDEMAMLPEMPVVVYRLYGITIASSHQISASLERGQHTVPKGLQAEMMRNMMSRIAPAFAKDRPVDCGDCAGTPSHPQKFGCWLGILIRGRKTSTLPWAAAFTPTRFERLPAST
ncbi:hypothetical protein AMS68_005849 [Peltaster fructicola]|uniref:Uncharacterized protein n=1 Tax=Peltaster fructicola TaxID=286661 RepID=A0A6H0XZX8_9PEZI|nr:hypothetical protein AMS68_005849 [Peltaster fructicola]